MENYVRSLSKSQSVSTIEERRTAFRQMLEAGSFVIPNPWNVGVDEVLQHCRDIVEATMGAELVSAAHWHGQSGLVLPTP